MSCISCAKDIAKQMREIDKLLAKRYGKRVWRRRSNAIEVLMRTILSQQTNDEACLAAYSNLIGRFKCADEIMRAPVEEIESAIKVAGLSKQKARYIRSCLERILSDFGALSLDGLAKMDIQRAMSYLTSLPGVGFKTAACVLLFAFGMPVFPVDTHIHRIARRMGLVKHNASAVETQVHLDSIVPNEIKYQLHLNLIEHGRRVCKSQKPLCDSCIITRYCQRNL
ncbi:MAG: endonuclease III [Armatimonadota bacterium]|nr:endonuclease III [Armatimonadota bacterium]MCX7776501.1 endonuclease III [Armatimonadota bacterium]MDW8024298.1 endonuclease III [Armatimonadota bacterium]